MRGVTPDHSEGLQYHVLPADDPLRADAAVAAQRVLDLPVRMGIATGEAELRDGDYFGTVLNRAARVMATGHGGGQVLLDGTTAGLCSSIDLIAWGHGDYGTSPNRSRCSKSWPSACVASFRP